MSWQGRQLVTAEKDGTTLSYTYDSEGIRTSKTVGSTTTEYLLNGTQILAQTTNGKTLSFFYDQQGNRVGMADSSNHFYYYIYNLQGDVIALADASTGKLAVTYTYDAWGKLMELKDTTANSVGTLNPFRYKGYYYDTETGLYYLNSRYYDAETGRFINADGQLNSGILGYNMFAYCENNPVMRGDPSGHLPFFAVTAAIGAAVGAVVGGVKAAKSGKSVLKGALKGAAVGGLIGLGAGAMTGVMLAGSASASVTSVVAGAKAFATTVGGAGLAAGMKMISDNVSQAFCGAPQVFWSGQDLAKNAARQIANDIGGKTLEMTKLGSTLEQSGASDAVWRAASSNFANVANNSSSAIYSVQNAAGIRIQSIWSTVEYPMLNGREIIYGVAFQNGSIQILP